ncbi:MAG TPA: hypothetical protein V6D28_30000 [Leptolyngbyaceae cyanobacterium]
MMEIKVKSQGIWDEISKIIADINVNNLVTQHLEACQFKLRGYWDKKDKFYEEITFTKPITANLSSSSFGTNFTENGSSNWVKLRFLLKADKSAFQDNGISDDEDDEIGDLTLILDENLQIVDENWIIDVESPFVVTKNT